MSSAKSAPASRTQESRQEAVAYCREHYPALSSYRHCRSLLVVFCVRLINQVVLARPDRPGWQQMAHASTASVVAFCKQTYGGGRRSMARQSCADLHRGRPHTKWRPVGHNLTARLCVRPQVKKALKKSAKKAACLPLTCASQNDTKCCTCQ